MDKDHLRPCQKYEQYKCCKSNKNKIHEYQKVVLIFNETYPNLNGKRSWNLKSSNEIRFVQTYEQRDFFTEQTVWH